MLTVYLIFFLKILIIILQGHCCIYFLCIYRLCCWCTKRSSVTGESCHIYSKPHIDQNYKRRTSKYILRPHSKREGGGGGTFTFAHVHLSKQMRCHLFSCWVLRTVNSIHSVSIVEYFQCLVGYFYGRKLQRN